MKTILFSLTIFLLAVSGTTFAYEPMIYENGWKTMSKEAISERMQEPVININSGEPFNFKVINKGEEEVARVNTPNEYYQQMHAGNELYIYTTYDIIDEGLFRGVAMSLLYLSKAKSSKHSYVRSFPFDKEDPLKVLPASFVSYHGSDQHEIYDKAVNENRSWRYIAPSSRILEMDSDNLEIYSTFAEDMYNSPEEERYNGNMPSHCISPDVLGDLNGDGYEDIVLNCAFYYVEGSGRYYYFSVLTRKSPDSVLEDIVDQVNEIFWKE